MVIEPTGCSVIHQVRFLNGAHLPHRPEWGASSRRHLAPLVAIAHRPKFLLKVPACPADT